jgi:hypothetical protein
VKKVTDPLIDMMEEHDKLLKSSSSKIEINNNHNKEMKKNNDNDNDNKKENETKQKNLNNDELKDEKNNKIEDQNDVEKNEEDEEEFEFPSLIGVSLCAIHGTINHSCRPNAQVYKRRRDRNGKTTQKLKYIHSLTHSLTQNSSIFVLLFICCLNTNIFQSINQSINQSKMNECLLTTILYFGFRIVEVTLSFTAVDQLRREMKSLFLILMKQNLLKNVNKLSNFLMVSNVTVPNVLMKEENTTTERNDFFPMLNVCY